MWQRFSHKLGYSDFLSAPFPNAIITSDNPKDLVTSVLLSQRPSSESLCVESLASVF